MSQVITVSAIAFLRGRRVLTVRKRGTESYMLPGGKPDAGESAVETAVREVREELGIEIAPRQLTLLGAFQSRAANEPGHALHATVYVTDAAVEPAVQAELDDARWVDPSQDHPDEAPLNREHVFPLLVAAAR